MDIYFRALTTADIPTVKHITRDIWEGDDYVPKVIAQWLQDDDGSMNFGVFREPHLKSESLVGLGRIKWLTPQKVWIEGGRIDPQVQKQGIGLQMTQYAVEYARTHGAMYIQYDTWGNRDHLGDPAYPQNHGSIILARKLGFIQKDYVDVLELEIDVHTRFPALPSQNCGRALSCEHAYTFYQRLSSPFGPKSEINQGWSYLPFEWEVFQELHEKYRWHHNPKAIIQVHNLKGALQASPESHDFHEVPLEEEYWIIVYGDARPARDLVLDFLHRRALTIHPNQKILAQIFCSPAISSELVPLGYHFIDHETSPSGVMLFEKKL